MIRQLPIIIDAEHAVVRGSRVRLQRRPFHTSSANPSTAGYSTFEEGQGFGFVGIPVEGYEWQQGATVWRDTSADRNQTFSGGTFTPVFVHRDAMDFSQEDTSQNLNVTVDKLHPVAQLFRSYNPATVVTLTIYRKHRSDEEQIIIFVGKVVSCNFEGPQATLVCAPVSHVFRRRLPWTLFQPLCNWVLYSTPCGLDKDDFKVSGFVSAIGATSIRSTGFATKPDGWFDNGWVELATGEMRFVISHVGDTVSLAVAFPSVSIGAAIDGFAGCNLSETECRVKFDNIENHLGFPRIPTRNPFDGSLV